MRITFVLPPVGMSGGIRVIAEYADRLRRRGHEVACIAQRENQPGLRERLRNITRGRGFTLPARGPSHFDGRDEGLTVLSRYGSVTADDVPDADVVVATWWETAEWVAEMPARKGAKAYLLQHDESGLPNQPSKRVRATWSLPLHRIAVSRWIADRVQAGSGGEVVVVPNSVDLELFQAPPREKQPTPTVGFMLAGQRWKGVDLAAEAALLARERLGGLKIIVFGAYDIRERFGLGSAAEFVQAPAQREIPGLYARCDAWLFASRYEGYGLPILEAMACRTPVIGTPAGAAPELLGGGGGVLVPSENASAMADAIVRLTQMPDARWREMSDNAYHTAAGYTWSDATDALERELKRAADGADASAGAVPADPEKERLFG
jgi:glycosyltransferase involved in cell wall biosynthesis